MTLVTWPGHVALLHVYILMWLEELVPSQNINLDTPLQVTTTTTLWWLRGPAFQDGPKSYDWVPGGNWSLQGPPLIESKWSSIGHLRHFSCTSIRTPSWCKVIPWAILHLINGNTTLHHKSFVPPVSPPSTLFYDFGVMDHMVLSQAPKNKLYWPLQAVPTTVSISTQLVSKKSSYAPTTADWKYWLAVAWIPELIMTKKKKGATSSMEIRWYCEKHQW